jgi:hypothetical protein
MTVDSLENALHETVLSVATPTVESTLTLLTWQIVTSRNQLQRPCRRITAPFYGDAMAG